MMKYILTEKVKNLVFDYYKCYYFDSLGISNWQSLISEFRFNEEILTGKRLLKYFDKFNLPPILPNSNVLIVGSGTGAELFFLSKQYPESFFYGIDPSESAHEICNLKKELYSSSNVFIHNSYAEDLPFVDSFFDLILCFTVLEHVESVPDSLSEMYRVLHPGGTCFVALPDYRWPEEQHYKLATLPPAFFSFFTPLHLRQKKRPVSFFHSLNLLTPRLITRILRRQKLPFRRLRELTYTVVRNPVLWIYSFFFRIDRNQFFLLVKDY